MSTRMVIIKNSNNHVSENVEKLEPSDTADVDAKKFKNCYFALNYFSMC